MAISLDGSAGNNIGAGSSLSVKLSTSKTNDIIIVDVHSSHLSSPHRTVSSISDSAGLTWAQRSSVTMDNAGAQNAYNDFERWWALSTGALSNDTITVSFSGSVDSATVLAYGVNGANTGTPWDANGSLPATATSSSNTTPTVSGISTTSASTLLLASVGTTNGGASILTGTIAGAAASGIFLNVHGAFSETYGEYVAVSSAQSGVSAAFGSSVNSWLMVVDALVAARAPLVFSDTINSVMTVGDSLANTATLANSFTETITAGDSASPAHVFSETISDTMTAGDSVVGGTLWISAATPTTTWTDASEPTSSWSDVSPVTGTPWTKQ